MKNLNIFKYSIACMLLSGFWAFIGGLLIGLGRLYDFRSTFGSVVFLLGSVGSIILLDYLIKRFELAWFYKGSARP
jgi:membrane-bound metal-dependent hydrolase YbcI (DUF457 family)